jgi:hypothetical protein
MSDLRSILARSVLALVACSAPLSAQHPAAPADSALRDVHRLDSLYEVRLARLTTLRDSLRRMVGWVEVSSGGLAIRTTPALESRAREAARRAMAAVEARGGDALRSRLARRLPVLATDTTAAMLGTEWVVWLQADTAKRDRNAFTFRSQGPIRADGLVPRFLDLIERFSLDGADSTLTAWLMFDRLPLRDAPHAVWEDAYTEFATTESSRLRACRKGDDEACLTSLGLGRSQQTLLDAWYDPEDYRALVGMAKVRRDSSDAASAERCRRTALATDCAAAARSIPDFRIPLLLSLPTRQLFVEEVFGAGGPRAYERLVAARGPVREQLAAAAGVPLSGVVSAWRARVLGARPESMMVTPMVALAALVWCCAFTAVALGRRGA